MLAWGSTQNICIYKKSKSLKKGMFFLLHKITIQALDNYCVIYLKIYDIIFRKITTRFNYFFKDRNV